MRGCSPGPHVSPPPSARPLSAPRLTTAPFPPQHGSPLAAPPAVPAVSLREDVPLHFQDHPDEARYRTLVRAISQIVWTTLPTGEFDAVDAAWTEYTGQSAEEARGWGWLDAVFPGDRVRVRQLWKRAIDTRSFYHIEHRLRRRDGMQRWVSARAAPVFAPDGSVREWIGTYTDIDEVRRAQEERARLFQAERRARSDAERLSEQLSDTIESISEPFIAFDRQWRVVRMNGATRRTLRAFGVDADTAIGRSLWELLPQFDETPFGEELRRAARSEAPAQFVAESPLSGRWFEVHVYPTRDGVATYALDVTERRVAEDRIRFLSEASRVLGSSLDYEETLDTVVRLAVPLLGDFCVLDLVDERGLVRRLAAAHADPSKEPLLAELRGHPPPVDDGNVVGRVIRTAVPEMGTTSGLHESTLGGAGAMRMRRLAELLQPRSYLCVPLVTNGLVLGTILCISSRDGSRYGDSDLEIAEELARRAALAVLHARTHEAERGARLAAERATQRLREAQEISTAATASQRLDEMLETLVERVRLALQADSASVLLLSRNGDELVLRASLGLEREQSETVRVGIGEGFAGYVAEVREPVVVADLSQTDVKSTFLREHIRSIVGVPLLAGGRLVGVLHCGTVEARDFTEDDVRLLTLVADRVAHAIERARLLEGEQEARAEAERANRAKMDFLAMMSHELRTPLNAIAGYAELLELGLRGPVNEQQQKDLQSIRRNERHLLSLIEEVLSFAKLDAGRVELDLHVLRVQMVVESVVSIVAPQLQAQGHTLELQPGDPSLAVHADDEKLQQILVNLLSNAIKFTDPGGRITVSSYAEGREVAIVVRDTGIGIAAEHHQRIFEPFVQLDVGLTRRVEGTGLGLSISRELARAMRGELVVESALNAGAAFTLRLPRATLMSPETSFAE